MSSESKTIAFTGLLVAGQTRGAHSRVWARTIQQFEISVDGNPPSGGDLSFQLVLDGVLQPQLFSLPADNAEPYILIDLDGDGLAVPANSVLAARCINAAGSSDVNLDLLASTKIYGAAQFGDAEVSGEDVMTLTAFLTADDVAGSFRSAEELIELLDNPVNPTGTLNAAVRDAYINTVQGTIEGALKRRYALPLVVPTADANSVLMTIGSRAIALWKFLAMSDKAHLLEAFPGVTTNNKNALAWLADVRDGVEFISARTLAGAPARTDATISSGHDGTFNRRRLKGW